MHQQVAVSLFAYMIFRKRSSVQSLYYITHNLKRPRLIKLNPLDPLLWILRRNESDIVNCYNFMTPYFRHATRGSNMLNFGYWSKKTEDPMQAQGELCSLVGEFANLNSAKNMLDVGSGFSAPAIQWKSIYNLLNIICVNINLLQLKTAKSLVNEDISSDILKSKESTITTRSLYLNNRSDNISLVNANAKVLPFKDKCMDRIIALESAQHFKPLIHFIQEAKRILKNDGLLVIAIPVTTTTDKESLSLAQQFRKLGILALTWASEHHELGNVRSLINDAGFGIVEIQNIGSRVYAPFTEYYVKNRRAIKSVILKGSGSSSSLSSPSLFHNILYDVAENFIYKSALKMKEISQKGLIDYVLIRAKSNN